MEQIAVRPVSDGCNAYRQSTLPVCLPDVIYANSFLFFRFPLGLLDFFRIVPAQFRVLVDKPVVKVRHAGPSLLAHGAPILLGRLVRLSARCRFVYRGSPHKMSKRMNHYQQRSKNTKAVFCPGR